MTNLPVCKCGQPCLLGSSKCHGCQHEAMFKRQEDKPQPKCEDTDTDTPATMDTFEWKRWI